MVAEGWKGMHPSESRIACNFAGMHLQLRRRKDLAGGSPQGNDSETNTTSSAETRRRGSESVYAKKFGSKRLNAL